MKSAFLVTWVTHNSRISMRMKDLGIKPAAPPLQLKYVEEVEITAYIKDVVLEDKLKVLAYNICKDHVHLLLVCQTNHLGKIVGKIKAESSRRFNLAHGYSLSRQGALAKTAGFPRQGGMPPCPKNLATASSFSQPCRDKKLRGQTQTQLWAQKFNRKRLDDDRYFYNSIYYVEHNRERHDLPVNRDLQKTIAPMLCKVENAFC